MVSYFSEFPSEDMRYTGKYNKIAGRGQPPSCCGHFHSMYVSGKYRDDDPPVEFEHDKGTRKFLILKLDGCRTCGCRG